MTMSHSTPETELAAERSGGANSHDDTNRTGNVAAAEECPVASTLVMGKGNSTSSSPEPQTVRKTDLEPVDVSGTTNSNINSNDNDQNNKHTASSSSSMMTSSTSLEANGKKAFGRATRQQPRRRRSAPLPCDMSDEDDEDDDNDTDGEYDAQWRHVSTSMSDGHISPRATSYSESDSGRSRSVTPSDVDGGGDESGAKSWGNNITGRWTNEEHNRFMQGLEAHGRDWRKIAKVVKTRSNVQVRTHAQKFFTRQEAQGNMKWKSLGSASSSPGSRPNSASSSPNSKMAKLALAEAAASNNTMEGYTLEMAPSMANAMPFYHHQQPQQPQQQHPVSAMNNASQHNNIVMNQGKPMMGGNQVPQWMMSYDTNNNSPLMALSHRPLSSVSNGMKPPTPPLISIPVQSSAIPPLSMAAQQQHHHLQQQHQQQVQNPGMNVRSFFHSMPMQTSGPNNHNATAFGGMNGGAPSLMQPSSANNPSFAPMMSYAMSQANNNNNNNNTNMYGMAHGYHHARLPMANNNNNNQSVGNNNNNNQHHASALMEQQRMMLMAAQSRMAPMLSQSRMSMPSSSYHQPFAAVSRSASFSAYEGDMIAANNNNASNNMMASMGSMPFGKLASHNNVPSMAATMGQMSAFGGGGNNSSPPQSPNIPKASGGDVSLPSHASTV